MAIGLSAEELSQIREDLDDLLPDTAYILTKTKTPDGEGSFTETWGTAGTASCRLDFLQPGKETVIADSLKPFQVGVLTLAYDKTIAATQRVEVNNIQYTVQGRNLNQSWIGVRRVAVQRA